MSRMQTVTCWDQREGQHRNGWVFLPTKYRRPFLVDLLALISEALPYPPSSFIRTAIPRRIQVQPQLPLSLLLAPS